MWATNIRIRSTILLAIIASMPTSTLTTPLTMNIPNNYRISNINTFLPTTVPHFNKHPACVYTQRGPVSTYALHARILIVLEYDHR